MSVSDFLIKKGISYKQGEGSYVLGLGDVKVSKNCTNCSKNANGYKYTANDEKGFIIVWYNPSRCDNCTIKAIQKTLDTCIFQVAQIVGHRFEFEMYK